MIPEETIVYKPTTTFQRRSKKHVFTVFTILLILCNLMFAGYFVYNEYFLVPLNSTEEYRFSQQTELNEHKITQQNIKDGNNRLALQLYGFTLSVEERLNKTLEQMFRYVKFNLGESFKINIITDLSHKMQSAYASILLPQVMNTISTSIATEFLKLEKTQQIALTQHLSSILDQNEQWLKNNTQHCSNTTNV